MYFIRKSDDRGYFDHGWLKSHHTFSFGDYMDPKWMGFGVLRVINEDFIEAGKGFQTHGHRDMEIISYVVSGELSHKDSMGNVEAIKPGEVQYMSAGTGVRHSEFNSLSDQTTHLMQIWILPNKTGHQPRYGQKNFVEEYKSEELTLVVSENGERKSIPVHQDIKMYVGHKSKAGELAMKCDAERLYWLQLIKGSIHFEGGTLTAGDAAGFQKVSDLKFSWDSGAEFIVFDLCA